MADLTLAEIVAEGESLHAQFLACPAGWEESPWETFRDFCAEHGPALLAVSKAAVELVDADDGDSHMRLMDARVALRAAVRSAKGGPDV
jgi:hypothetical protein